jgi:hypothetical protein
MPSRLARQTETSNEGDQVALPHTTSQGTPVAAGIKQVQSGA